MDSISSGSSAEGTMTTVSDRDNMIVNPFIVVVQNRKEMRASHCNVLLVNRSYSNPGYTTLQYLGKENVLQQYFEETPDGIFVSSEKVVRSLVDNSYLLNKMFMEGFRKHGPCISSTMPNYFGLITNTRQNLKVERDDAFALVCNSWPAETMEWITRNRRHDWPSRNLLSKIRKEDCHVVPVCDPTSKFSSLEWRFSFLLAERQLIWSFNDTQIQCYFILKSLIKKYIHPTFPDEVTSYHLKTIVFWQSENLGITAWSEDQLLHRVHDCLSYLSQCVQHGQLEHYFYRSNNLLRHKLKKSDDRKFVLDTIKAIKKNLTATVLDIIPKDDLLIMHSKYGKENVDQLLSFLVSATQREYGRIRNVLGKLAEYSSGIFTMLANVTKSLEDVDLLQWAYKVFRDRPPADVDPIYIEHILLCIYIRLAVHLYRATLDNSLSEETRNNLISISLLSMAIGANINYLIGKLYLATLHFCLKEFRNCETLTGEALTKKWKLYPRGSETSSFIKACKSDLKIIHEHIPGFVDSVVKIDFGLVFSRKDIDFVPYPLKFECATLTQEDYPILIFNHSVYALTLLFMTHLSMTNIRLARRCLIHLAELVYRSSDSLLEAHRAYNLLGCCYSLDGQRYKAASCYIKSLKRTKTSPLGNKNAALYHLAIVCLDIYKDTRRNTGI